MRFDWDDEKNQLNLQKHGIAFEIAVTAFEDPYAWVAPDWKHTTTVEFREIHIGK